MTNKLTKETLANFLYNEHHNGQTLDFDKCVINIENSSCFLLKFFSPNDEIARLYLVCPIDRLVAETSQPFYGKILRYFKNIVTNPMDSYWIAYIEIDETSTPIKSQIFKIPDNL
jgi:hypothetical protein